ncbi:MAG: MerR family transcriptional regulator [Ruminococcus sp.]|nr:MerR family transcriptional regulator [Ruminococcus sp.]
MSTYTTGEVAKLCGVTVRTVQYYDTRGILNPSQLSEGGRRLYSEDDVKKMKVICFLRDLGFSIDAISKLLKEEHPENVITLLIKGQEQELTQQLSEQKEKLEKLQMLEKELRSVENFSFESIGDIAHNMTNKKEMKKIHMTMLLTGIPVSLLQIAAIVLLIFTGIWWPLIVWAVIAIPWGILISKYYFDHTAYICPECHEVFHPSFKEAFFAPHTPKTRKLTCPKCEHKGYCVETVNPETTK